MNAVAIEPAIGLLLPAFGEFIETTLKPVKVDGFRAVDSETLREAGITVLKSVTTAHGTRHRIETACGRVLWTYDLEGYAVSRLSRVIARERADLERVSDEEALTESLPFQSKGELYALIKASVDAGEITVKAASIKYHIPRSTLRDRLGSVALQGKQSMRKHQQS
jgi:hypothetical protein